MNDITKHKKSFRDLEHFQTHGRNRVCKSEGCPWDICTNSKSAYCVYCTGRRKRDNMRKRYPVCQVGSACPRKVHRRGMCRKHYNKRDIYLHLVYIPQQENAETMAPPSVSETRKYLHVRNRQSVTILPTPILTQEEEDTPSVIPNSPSVSPYAPSTYIYSPVHYDTDTDTEISPGTPRSELDN